MIEIKNKIGELTFSTLVSSENVTVEPLISLTFGLMMTDPDRIFKGRSSLITGILLKSLRGAETDTQG